MDNYYDCVWDTTVLEYLANLHIRRGEMQKHKLVLEAFRHLDLNPNNSDEVLERAIQLRKSKFMRALSRQYMLSWPCHLDDINLPTLPLVLNAPIMVMLFPFLDQNMAWFHHEVCERVWLREPDWAIWELACFVVPRIVALCPNFRSFRRIASSRYMQ